MGRKLVQHFLHEQHDAKLPYDVLPGARSFEIVLGPTDATYLQQSKGSKGGMKECGVEEINPKIVEYMLRILYPTYLPRFEPPE